VQLVNPAAHLLRSASRRLRWAAFGRWFYRSTLALAGVALVGLLLARMLSALPQHWFTPLTLCVVPTLALLAALIFTRRPEPAVVARTVDHQAGTKELFLTASLIGDAPAEYRELVVAEAERRAGDLRAGRLLPLRWMPGARDIGIALAVLLAGVLWLPSFDPFRMEQKRTAQAKQEKRLEETRQITAMRKEELIDKGKVFDAQVEQALAKLDKTLKDAKPEKREEVAKQLKEESQDFSELWKKAQTQLPREALEKAAQQFGDTEQMQAMKELLQKLKDGDPEALKQAMQKLREKMEQIAKQPEGADKQQQLEQMSKELGKLAQQMKEQLGDKNLSDALSRALEQMDLAKDKDLAKQALDAANESLKLSQEEAQRLGEMFKDMKNVEDAMKALQAAKQLNDKGKLAGQDGKDGQPGEGKSPTDYKALYEKLMAQAGQEGEGGNGDGDGDGDGNGKDGKRGRGRSGKNPGTGNGGNVGEDPSAKTAMKPDKDPAQIGAGKLLMQWKEEGVGDTGNKAVQYQNALRTVKQGVAEAIRSEQVPPGYHSAIQKYFDRLGEKK